MTGNEIAVIRRILRWSLDDFAKLTGASLSAVYRWEKQGALEAKLDPHFRTVLGLLRELLNREDEKTCREHLETVRQQGAQRGLYMILGLYYDRGRKMRDTPWRNDPPPLPEEFGVPSDEDIPPFGEGEDPEDPEPATAGLEEPA